jgi:hypothetical protein
MEKQLNMFEEAGLELKRKHLPYSILGPRAYYFIIKKDDELLTDKKSCVENITVLPDEMLANTDVLQLS